MHHIQDVGQKVAAGVGTVTAGVGGVIQSALGSQDGGILSKLRDTKRMDVLLRKNLALTKERDGETRKLLETRHTTFGGKLRAKAYYVMELPHSSCAAALLSWLVMICIVVSTVAFVVETLPSMKIYFPHFFNLEIFVVCIFSCEYLFRLFSAPMSTYEFVTTPMNVIDLISVLPFFIELAFYLFHFIYAGTKHPDADLRVLRVVRLFRLLRLLKLVRHAKSMLLVRRALQETCEALVTILAFLFMAFIFFSAASLAAERGSKDEALGCYVRAGDSSCSPFESIPLGLYWAATTITSVGYGDVYPTSPAGKVVASLSMVVGVISVAFPIIVVSFHLGSRFVSVFAEMESTRPLLNSFREEWDVHYAVEARPPFIAKQNDLYVSLEAFDDAILSFEELRTDSQMLGSAVLHLKGHALYDSCLMTELQSEIFTLGIEKSLDTVRAFVLDEIRANFIAGEVMTGNEKEGRTPPPPGKKEKKKKPQPDMDDSDRLLEIYHEHQVQPGQSAPAFFAHLRYSLFKLLDEPGSSRSALVCCSYFCLCVLASCVSILCQTIPSVQHKYDFVWFRLEMYNTMTFTLEYLLRLTTTPQTFWQFTSDRMNTIDLIGILPMYVELLIWLCVHWGLPVPEQAIFALRVMRLCRLLRLFRFAKYWKAVHTVCRALQESKDAFFLLAFFMGLGLVLSGALMYSVERGQWEEDFGCYVRLERPDLGCSPFQSIPHSFYWGVTTMTTVGYGDTYPVTPTGKVIASVTMILGLLAIALPVSMISDRFVLMIGIVEAENEAKQMQIEMKSMQRGGHLTEEVNEHFDDSLQDLQQVRAELKTFIPAFEAKIAAVIAEDNLCRHSKEWWRKLYDIHKEQILGRLDLVLEEYEAAQSTAPA